jgi:hypothetical protein
MAESPPTPATSCVGAQNGTYSTARNALARSATSNVLMSAGSGPESGGTSAWVKPNLAASVSLLPTPVTLRTSPANPTSPMATSLGDSARSRIPDHTAKATARSTAGSVTFMPPTVAV